MSFRVVEVCSHKLHYGSQKKMPANGYGEIDFLSYGRQTKYLFDTAEGALQKAKSLYKVGAKKYGGFQDFIVVEE